MNIFYCQYSRYQAMARRKIEIFTEVNNEKEFESIVQNNRDHLICAEIYSIFAGWCTALERLFTTIKLDWSNGRMILLRVPADIIEVLRRFRNQSEPVFMFIVNGMVTKVFRGVDTIGIAEVAKKELYYFMMEQEGSTTERPIYALDEPTADETEWITTLHIERTLERQSTHARRAARQVARKKHRAELLVPFLQRVNFVLFWPHTTHAHFELYERWDRNNIIMVGREELIVTQEEAEDILYEGDAYKNEASMYKLLSGPVLAICFRSLDTDIHFVSLVRKILYEEIPEMDDSKPMSEQPQRKTAFELYKTYSLSREEIWQIRRQERIKHREEELEKRARRGSEMRRLAIQAKEEAIEAKRIEKEQRKLELLKAGNLTALDHLSEEVDEEEDIVIPEESPEEMEEEMSEEEDENEYFPPAGLPVPGLYAPPNDIAKANGLAILFPKIVAEYVTPEPEFLPPHVLVMLSIFQRYTAIEVMHAHASAIIHIGVFKATTPYDATHVAYSVNQYDKLNLSLNEEELRLALMVSVKVDIPLLELMDLNPLYVSRDPDCGEEDCAALFPVDYADDYPEFEDFGDRRIRRTGEEAKFDEE